MYHWFFLFVACNRAGSSNESGATGETGTSVEAFACDPLVAIGDGLPSQGLGEDFIALAAGDPVVITHGPQGGEHIWFGGRVEGPGPTLFAEARVTDLRDGSDLSLGGSVYAIMPDFDGCSGTFVGGRALLRTLSSEELCALDGAPLRLDLEIYDFDGTYYASGRTSVTGPPDATASIDVTGTLDAYVLDCFCGGSGTSYCGSY